MNQMRRILVWGIVIGMSWIGVGQASAEDAPKPQAVHPTAAASPTKSTVDSQSPSAVQDEMEVGVEYTLTSEGTVVDSNQGQAPLRYVHGRRQIIPGLERALTGLHVGDSKEVTVSPEDGYGPIDPSKVVEVPREQLPPDVTPTVGMVLRGVNGNGRGFPATVKEVKDKTVVLDLNHPLVGKTLHFKVKITDIAPAKPKS